MGYKPPRKAEDIGDVDPKEIAAHLGLKITPSKGKIVARGRKVATAPKYVKSLIAKLKEETDASKHSSDRG